jgi:hypothetical protein
MKLRLEWSCRPVQCKGVVNLGRTADLTSAGLSDWFPISGLL